MKVLLAGPYPPPHGGISVHMCELRRQLQQAGSDCRVVNVDPRAPDSDDYISIRGGFSLFSELLSHARRGWMLHVHSNGHNPKSWLIALTAGLAGVAGPGSVLTLHSGLAPAYLAGSLRGRWLAKLACFFYRRVVAVSPEVRDAVLSLGVSAERVNVVPAFLFAPPAEMDSPELSDLKERRPILATTLFFRPEYGFDLLVEAMDRLRVKFPEIACVVMGTGKEQELEQAAELVATRGLGRSIVFLGNIAHERCLAIISKADLFVRPTRVDGDANSVREALALGTAVVASEVGNRPPGVVLFRTGDGGDLAAKIEDVLLRPRMAPTSGESDWGHIETLLGIYESLGRRQREQHGQTQPIS